MIDFYNVGENKSFEENAGTDEASKLTNEDFNGDEMDNNTGDNEEICDEAAKLTSEDHNGDEMNNNAVDDEEITDNDIKTFVLVLIFIFYF